MHAASAVPRMARALNTQGKLSAAAPSKPCPHTNLPAADLVGLGPSCFFLSVPPDVPCAHADNPDEIDLGEDDDKDDDA